MVLSIPHHNDVNVDNDNDHSTKDFALMKKEKVHLQPQEQQVRQTMFGKDGSGRP